MEEWTHMVVYLHQNTIDGSLHSVLFHIQIIVYCCIVFVVCRFSKNMKKLKHIPRPTRNQDPYLCQGVF